MPEMKWDRGREKDFWKDTQRRDGSGMKCQCGLTQNSVVGSFVPFARVGIVYCTRASNSLLACNAPEQLSSANI